jgi:hypothetical protein
MTPAEHVEQARDAQTTGPGAGGTGKTGGTDETGETGGTDETGETGATGDTGMQQATSHEPSFLKDAPWGAIVVISGLIAIVIIFVFAIEHYKQASDVATATASVSGVIAALVGAYFGIRGSSLAQEKAQNAGANRKTF